jgi:hypothetical protein
MSIASDLGLTGLMGFILPILIVAFVTVLVGEYWWFKYPEDRWPLEELAVPPQYRQDNFHNTDATAAATAECLALIDVYFPNEPLLRKQVLQMVRDCTAQATRTGERLVCILQAPLVAAFLSFRESLSPPLRRTLGVYHETPRNTLASCIRHGLHPSGAVLDSIATGFALDAQPSWSSLSFCRVVVSNAPRAMVVVPHTSGAAMLGHGIYATSTWSKAHGYAAQYGGVLACLALPGNFRVVQRNDTRHPDHHSHLHRFCPDIMMCYDSCQLLPLFAVDLAPYCPCKPLFVPPFEERFPVMPSINVPVAATPSRSQHPMTLRSRTRTDTEKR